jgi:Protein of unknown function (DUF5818)
MKVLKTYLPVALLLTLAISVALAAQWTGTIVDQKCAVAGNLKGDHMKHLSADNPAVFVNESDNKIYTLQNGSRAETLLGKRVTVQGEVDGSTIKVESIIEVPQRTGE